MRDGPNHPTHSGPPTGADSCSTLSLDAVLELLANRRRRFGLYSLGDAPDGTLPIETLVEEVATLEAGITGEPLTRERYLAVASDLHHWHLEVLAESEVVAVDVEAETVQYLGDRLLETWLDRLRRSELPS